MLKLHSTTFVAVGTKCHLHLYASTPSDAEAVAYSAIQEVLRIEARYSRYRADSFLSQINLTAQHGAVIEVDEETAGLLDYAYACHQKSGGCSTLRQASCAKLGIFRCNVCRNNRRLIDYCGLLAWIKSSGNPLI